MVATITLTILALTLTLVVIMSGAHLTPPPPLPPLPPPCISTLRYPLYSASIALLGGVLIPYELNESAGGSQPKINI